MSKIFGPSLRNITSSTELRSEVERFNGETSNVVSTNKNIEEYFVRNMTRINGRRNPTINSGLFSRTNVEGYEELSEIDIEDDANRDLNAPSTSTASRFFLKGASQNRYNEDLNRLDPERRFTESSNRLFGPSSGNSTFSTALQPRGQGRLNEDPSVRSSNTSSTTFGLESRNARLGLLAQDKGRLTLGSSFRDFNMSALPRTFGREYRMNVFSSSSVQNERLNEESHLSMSRGLGPGFRNATIDLLPHAERSNQGLTTYRSNSSQVSLPRTSRTFGPTIRSTTLSTRSELHEPLRFNEETSCNGGFVKPAVPKFRPRCSTISSRLFSHQTIERCSKDSSSVNGFNTTQFSRRDRDTFSESRLPLTFKQNGMDNQSVAGSFLSVSSAAAHFRNVLENLHHSILNSVPNIHVDLVRMEFDKAKKDLESINEMSFAPTVREGDAASVISHTSKYNYPAIPNETQATTFEGTISLKTGKEVLKSLVTRSAKKNNFPLSQVEEEKQKSLHEATYQSQSSEHESVDSALVFKKLKPFSKRSKKSLRSLKIRTPQVTKNMKSKATSKIINLKQWYPIAIVADLAFCGNNDEGTFIQTAVIKKRINNRKVELIDGLECNLIGSPSKTIVSVLPKSIISRLQNGLTPRWRVLQKEILNGQKMLEKSRNSKSPKSSKRAKSNSPIKKKQQSNHQAEKMEIYENTPIRKPSPVAKITKEREKTPSKKKIAVKSTPKQLIKRSSPVKVAIKQKKRRGKMKEGSKIKEGRKSKSSPRKSSPKKKSPKGTVTPQTDEKVSPPHTRSGRAVKPPSKFWMVAAENEMNSAEVTETPEVTSTNDVASSKKSKIKLASRETPVKPTSPVKISKEKEAKEVAKVSSRDDAKSQTRSQPKRKREFAVEVDSTQRKKSKSEKVTESFQESTENEVEQSTKKVKQSKKEFTSKKRSRNTKAKKVAQEKKQENSEKRMKVDAREEKTRNITEYNEFEDDFELNLSDIEIPEIAKIKCRPQINRSQLRLVSMETPPLKYFNNNLKILKNVTPVQSPDWFISQRSESEVKQFQRRRAQAHKRKVQVEKKKTTQTVIKHSQSKDLKKVLDWVADKAVRSPIGGSKLLQYVLPSRKQMEEDDEEEEDEDVDGEFFDN